MSIGSGSATLQTKIMLLQKEPDGERQSKKRSALPRGDVQTKFTEEECVLSMGQKSNDAVLKDAPITSSREERA